MISKSYVVFEGVDIVGWTQGFIDLTLEEIENGERPSGEKLSSRKFCPECLFEFEAPKGRKFCSRECYMAEYRRTYAEHRSKNT